MGHSAGHDIDPTFYRSPADAISAPPEQLAYVVVFDRAAQQPDALAVLDTDPASDRYGQVVGWADLPTRGDELHHFGWNACSSAFAHAGHDTDGLQRRYLLLPGLRSSNIHVYDTHPDPRQPTLAKTISAAELAAKAGYSRPHTLHCGPDGIFVSCLGGGNGADGPGGIALLDHDTFDVLRAWETDRGDQYLAYDAWWHLNQNTLITSEWGTPSMIEDGVNPELLLGQKYGHRLHFWDLALAGGPQMVEVSRDGKRIYLTNSLYGSWDDQFYPDGVGSWFAKIDTDPAAGGGLRVDEKFFPRGEDFRGRRVHQVRLGGGDASSDSYCYRS
jgi:selenium-binding protein 1